MGKILVPDAKMIDNGKRPDSVCLIAIRKYINLVSPVSDNDVIGYRVYSGSKKIASIHSGSSLTISATNSSYYVTAVDIAGKESAAI